MELYADIHLGCASICRRVGGHIHWGDLFFGAAGFLLGLDSLCLFRREAIFSFKFWEAASIVSLGEAKMASFLRSSFGFEFGAKVCLFWSLWQVIPDWLVLEATGCEQRELSLVCCGFYKHDSGS